MLDHSKIISPRLARVVARQRLFNHLDELSDYDITWISAPAGSGKTTLVASYLHAKAVPSLWYRIDEDDADVATFFYYMSEAAKRLRKGRKTPLPRLAGEFRAGMNAFTRHFFKMLFDKLPRPCAVVFDNYQDVPLDSVFHETMKAGLAQIPDGVRVFLLSRNEPPVSFVSFDAQSKSVKMGGEELRFTLDEVRDMVTMKKKSVIADDKVHNIHHITRGWAAAVVLMIESGGTPSADEESSGRAAVFNYIAVEVFRGLSESLQRFLLLTAFLPSISTDVAARLTGRNDAGSVLSGLNRSNYFTDRYGDEYRFHPLMKEFLMSQAHQRYGAEETARITIRTATLLEEFGRTEDAIILFLRCGAYAKALPLIIAFAPQLLAQGRNDTLEEWVAQLPSDLRQLSPWLSYWCGLAKLLSDPSGTRRVLEGAFKAFESQQDRIGSLLCVATIVASIVFGWDDYSLLDSWIDWIDANVDRDEIIPVPEVEAQISSAMVSGLTWRRPWYSHIGTWLKRADVASQQLKDLPLWSLARSSVADCYLYLGDWSRVHSIHMEFMRVAAMPEAPPMVKLSCLGRTIYLQCIMGDPVQSYQSARKAAELAKEIGAFSQLGIVYAQAAMAAFELNRLEECDDIIDRLAESVTDKKGILFRYRFTRFFYDFKKGKLDLALRDAQSALDAVLQTGRYSGEVLARLALAYVLRRLGRYEEAWSHVKRIEEILSPLGPTHDLYLTRLVQASLWLDENATDKANEALRTAFAWGREKGYGSSLYCYWQPEELARLCSKALAEGIETDYSRELIKRHHLAPAGPVRNSEDWPWKVRIRTLGGFEVVIDDKLLTFNGKVKKRPLALLKTLISCGGRGVAYEKIADALWPETDGDLAFEVFKKNVARLRRLLGSNDLIISKAGKLSLSSADVWLDIWELESLSKSSRELQRTKGDDSHLHRVRQLVSDIANVYKGEFLPHEDDEIVCSQRNHARTMAAMIARRLLDILKASDNAQELSFLNEWALEKGIYLDK